MGDHMLVVKDVLLLLDYPAIFRASIVRIAILLNDSLSCKVLRKACLADIVLNTPLRRARTMEHISGDSSMKLGMDSWIRNLG